jgi:hypothetical protein
MNKLQVEYHKKDGTVVMIDGVKMDLKGMGDWLAYREKIVGGSNK